MPLDEVETIDPLELVEEGAPAPLGMRLLPPSTGWVELHPRYRERFASLRLLTAEAFLDLPGEIVSGHPDRHVAKVQLPGWNTACFLKRQHSVGVRECFRQWRAGFGWSSRSVREARILRELEKECFDGPQWLAHGEDGQGQAFVLVEEIPEAVELRRLLSDSGLSHDERSRLAEGLGRTIAELHAAGFATPDLSAKHVFVNADIHEATLIDWQSSRRAAPGFSPLPLAALHASLADQLAGRRERLRFLWAYRRTLRRVIPLPRFSEMARDIDCAAQQLLSRRSIRDQRQSPVTGPEQRLVWLAGEAVCAIPEIAANWPKPAIAAPFYNGPNSPDGSPITVSLPDGRRAELLRGRSFQPFAALLGRGRRTPGANFGRLLFHLERYAIPAPRLYAFGQRILGTMRADWFVLHESEAGQPLAKWLTYTADVQERREAIEQANAILDQLHDAGCRLTGRAAPFRISEEGRVMVGDLRAVRLVKSVSAKDRSADRQVFLRSMPGLTVAERRLMEGGV
ncbi:MAG TPA: lipopolysaccharide kinase InaA family protein [Urbifossiella sp.]|nr:lipopolysaccharide kinase InaA family protein [Urbifossiella sp.]